MTSRVVIRWPAPGPHQGHAISANRRDGSFAGKKLRMTILRCKPCGVLVGLDQVRV